jgi:hypothetical protein
MSFQPFHFSQSKLRMLCMSFQPFQLSVEDAVHVLSAFSAFS